MKVEEGAYTRIIKHLKDEWRRGCTFLKHLLFGRYDARLWEQSTKDEIETLPSHRELTFCLVGNRETYL